jgi:hypothetical protein
VSPSSKPKVSRRQIEESDGYDVTKKIKGGKRRVAIDNSGPVPGVFVHAADI